VAKYRKTPQWFGLIALIILPFSGMSQEEVVIQGRVVEAASGEIVPGLYVVNKKSEKGALTDQTGRFRIAATSGDTLVFSHLSYSYTFYVVTGLEEGQIRFEMKERDYLLDEVGVYSYELTTNQPREMKLKEPRIPSTEDIVFPEQAPVGISSPIDYLYQLWGDRPRQLRELKSQMQQDAFRQKLSGTNRDILTELTGLSEQQLRELAFYCRYSPSTIRYATDYQLLGDILRCYEEFQEERALQDLMEEYD
jgi:hypothetical protein